ncbi:MAG: TetR/AcrR family transcriptional regulator [Verrucomicrobiales bacterium]|nr:TetR/AcrR family transcriptional regulator [Verrucomicrobiales bacterium]
MTTKSHSKRDEILEVASRLFYEQGYNATGIKQIIEEAGAAKGTFYSHFKSKEELGLAWLKARHITWNQWLSDAIDQKNSAGEKLLGIFDFLGDWMVDCDYRGCAFLNTLCELPNSGAPLRKEISSHKSELHKLIQTLVAEHHRKLTKKQTDAIGTVLFLLFEGTLVELQNFREPWPLVEARKQAESMLKT